MVLKLKIIKQELQFEECLKQRLEFICEFAKVTPTFINGSIRKLEKTNLTYIEPHRVIIKNITFLVFNYSNELPKNKIDERRGIEYHLKGDYYIPNLVSPKQDKIVLNKYGRMKLNYLKENKEAEYTVMLMNGILNAHLKELQETADNRVQQIISELRAKSNLTEDMKNTDMLYWVGTMNAIKAQAEEIVFSELIYS